MSTAKTAIGCLAEDYPMHLGLICANWLDAEERYYKAHPDEMTPNVQFTMDIAQSIVIASAAYSKA